MFVPLFRRHAALIKRVFQDVSSVELQQLEGALKKIGKRAESLAEKNDQSAVSGNERNQRESVVMPINSDSSPTFDRQLSWSMIPCF
jgi:hypothetical protein